MKTAIVLVVATVLGVSLYAMSPAEVGIEIVPPASAIKEDCVIEREQAKPTLHTGCAHLKASPRKEFQL